MYPKGDGTSYFHLGQLRIDSRPPQHLKLVLVYAGGKYDKTAVANELNTIYNRVGIHWQVSEVQNFTYDKATIETLFDKQSGLLSAYNDRMTSLNQALQSHLGNRYQADACYVFMADKSDAGKDRDIIGFMPRGRQYGYVYVGGLKESELASVLAHELAHGKCKLYHTFDQTYGKDRTKGENPTNLMDYSSGTHLAKWQWNQLYDPAILNGVFDRDEDGEWVQLAQCATGAVIDFAMYYSVTWISMFFDDSIEKAPLFYDYNAITSYKEFSWKEAGISAGISCASSVLPAFSSTKNARTIAVGLAAFGGAATGMATEFGKQYDVTIDALKKQNIETSFVNVLPEINWKPIFVTTGITGAITAASTLIVTSPKYAVLLAKMKTKLGATNSNLKSKLTKFVEGKLAKSKAGVTGAGSLFKVGDNLVGIAIKQIKSGTNGKYAIIGRSMGKAEVTGVRNIYSELKNVQKLDVEIFDASSLTGVWKTNFDDALAEFAQKTNNWTTKLSNQELLQLKMYNLNKEWAQHLVDDGYTILDMGDFNNLGFSVFYSMEKMTIFK